MTRTRPRLFAAAGGLMLAGLGLALPAFASIEAGELTRELPPAMVRMHAQMATEPAMGRMHVQMADHCPAHGPAETPRVPDE